MADTVLVTGASGFIAQHVILALLDKGYDVRGTVRSAAKGDALKAVLAAHNPAAADIELATADLMSDAGWDAAAQGCRFVQHVASPIPTQLPKDPNDLILPARDGTLRVLKAARAGGVERVVMTSSIAAIAYGWGDRRPDILTEEHWSDPENLKDNTAYMRSKTCSERAAWDYVRGEGAGLELATINPVAVLGPVLSADFSTSLEIVTQLMGGALPATPRVGFHIVDVRDVAEAHVLAMTTPGAAGERFIVADAFYWFEDVADMLRAEYPAYAKKIPNGQMPSFLLKLLANFNPVLKQVVPELDQRRGVSADKARRVLGWTPRSAKSAILASAQSLIDHKLL